MIFKVSFDSDHLQELNEAVGLYDPMMDISKFSKKNKVHMCFEMDGNMGKTNFDKDPYFKAYNADSPTKSTAVARIFMDEKSDLYYNPRYTNHPTNPRLPRPLWNLTQPDKNLIDYICRNVIILSKIDNQEHTVWENILLGYEVITGKKIYLSQPDYTRLVYMSTGGQGKKNQSDPNRKRLF